MSKVNVSLQGVFLAPANVPVSVKSVLVADQNVVVGTVGALPELKTVRTDSSGRVPGGFDLLTGRYEISAQSATIGVGYRVVIDVPNDAAAYEHTQLIVSGAAPFSQPVSTNQNASDSAYGLVRLTKAPGSNARVAVGVWHKLDVADMRTIATDVGNTFCTLLKRQAGEPREFYWDANRNDADDAVGFTIVRPNDFVAMGSMGVWVVAT